MRLARVIAAVLVLLPASAVAVDVTYVGNEGFLIASGDKKVLVDALYRDGVRGYVVIPPQLQAVLEQAQAPFDGVDFVLTTHVHDDHYDAGAVGNYLAFNVAARFISTPHATAELASIFASYDDIEDRVIASLPAVGETDNYSFAGIDVTVLNVHHGHDSPDNLGFIVDIDGFTFLHLGDSAGDKEDFEAAGVSDQVVDVAFVPYWYLSYEVFLPAANEIKARTIVAMHIPPRDDPAGYLRDLGGWAGMVRAIAVNFGNVVIFENEMETRAFQAHE